MTQDQDDLGKLIDSLDSVASMVANKLLPDKIHIEFLRGALPDLVNRMKAQFALVFGEDPWAE